MSDSCGEVEVMPVFELIEWRRSVFDSERICDHIHTPTPRTLAKPYPKDDSSTSSNSIFGSPQPETLDSTRLGTAREVTK